MSEKKNVCNNNLKNIFLSTLVLADDKITGSLFLFPARCTNGPPPQHPVIPSPFYSSVGIILAQMHKTAAFVLISD